MSFVDLLAVEASYRNDKQNYDDLMGHLNYSPQTTNNNKKEKVLQAAQMNADMQTSLLSMSNLLPPSSVEHFSLLQATQDLEEDYSKLVSDSRTISDMYKARYFAWGFFALVVLIGLARKP
jgi:hypothetical protein